MNKQERIKQLINNPELSDKVLDIIKEYSPIPLQEKMDRYIYKAIVHNKGNRTHTKEQLGICIRTLRMHLNRMRKLGYSIPQPQSGVPKTKHGKYSEEKQC